jgi:formate dehydrogenase maturation protein FdhE
VTARRSCPGCGKIGFIRAERVIKGGTGVTELRCSACEHAWTERDDVPVFQNKSEQSDDHA